MIVKGIERTSRQVEVEISFEDALEAIKREVFRSVGINDCEAYVSLKGEIVSDSHSGGGGHSWIDTDVLIKEPTEDQLKAISLCRSLRLFMKRN